MGELGAERPPPRRPFVGNFVLSSGFLGFECLHLEDLRKKGAQKHGFISVKKNIPAEIIDLRHIYLIDIH